MDLKAEMPLKYVRNFARHLGDMSTQLWLFLAMRTAHGTGNKKLGTAATGTGVACSMPEQHRRTSNFPQSFSALRSAADMLQR